MNVSKELDFKELQKLAAEILGVDEKDVQLDKSFAKDLAADSLDLVELIAAVEDKYDVEPPEEELENMKTNGDSWKFQEQKTAGRRGDEERKQERVLGEGSRRRHAVGHRQILRIGKGGGGGQCQGGDDTA